MVKPKKPAAGQAVRNSARSLVRTRSSRRSVTESLDRSYVEQLNSELAGSPERRGESVPRIRGEADRVQSSIREIGLTTVGKRIANAKANIYKFEVRHKKGELPIQELMQEHNAVRMELDSIGLSVVNLELVHECGDTLDFAMEEFESVCNRIETSLIGRVEAVEFQGRLRTRRVNPTDVFDDDDSLTETHPTRIAGVHAGPSLLDTEVPLSQELAAVMVNQDPLTETDRIDPQTSNQTDRPTSPEQGSFHGYSSLQINAPGLQEDEVKQWIADGCAVVYRQCKDDRKEAEHAMHRKVAEVTRRVAEVEVDTQHMKAKVTAVDGAAQRALAEVMKVDIPQIKQDHLWVKNRLEHEIIAEIKSGIDEHTQGAWREWKEKCERMERRIFELENRPVGVRQEALGQADEEVRSRVEDLEREIRSLNESLCSYAEISMELKRKVDSAVGQGKGSPHTSTPAGNGKENPRWDRRAQKPQEPEEQRLSPPEVQTQGVRRLMKQMRETLEISVTTSSDPSEIKQCYKEIVPETEKRIKECNAIIAKLSIQYEVEELNLEINLLVAECDEWISTVKKVYSVKRDILQDKSKFAPDIVVNKFAGNKEQIVHEFIADFEAKYAAITTGSQRADILYRNYLTESLKNQVFKQKDDYAALKRLLIELYGHPEKIVGDILEGLLARKQPNAGDDRANYKYFSEIQNSIQRIERLMGTTEVDKKLMQEELHSRSTMTALCKLVNTGVKTRFVQMLSDRCLNTRLMATKHHYETFKLLVSDQVEALAACAEEDADEDSVLKKKQQGSVAPKVVSSAGAVVAVARAAPWWQGQLEFPCPVGGHVDHEIVACDQFLAMTAVERRSLENAKLMCWTCLKPKTACVTRNCSFANQVPASLKCKGCAKFAVPKGLVPFNVLFCPRMEHNAVKPTQAAVLQDLRRWCRNVDPNVTESMIIFTVTHVMGAQQAVVLSSNARTGGRAVGKPKAIDTQTGREAVVSPNQVVEESGEPVAFLLQWIRVGEKLVQVLYDRGANVNIVSREVAEAGEFRCVDTRAVAINTVGGEALKANVGVYDIVLGSSGGGWHSVMCEGMEIPTVEFPKYDLAEVNREVRAMRILPPAEMLPEMVGGGVTGLLIGIKDVSLDPQLVAVLPSGWACIEHRSRIYMGQVSCMVALTGRSVGAMGHMARHLQQ